MKRKNIIIAILCMLCAIAFLLIATKSSPLYVCNDWVDSNIFFNIAKGIVHGKVPYRDLFEQKGPLLYFIYTIPYLISNDTFIGVFLLEIIAVWLTLFLVYQLVHLFYNEKASLLTVPIFAFFYLNTKAFVHGGCAEELCMPMIMLTLYQLVKYFKLEYPNPISRKTIFINGILAGIVLWTKYTFLGFYFAFCLIVGITLLKEKRIKEIFISAGIFLLGMLLVTILPLAYFAIHGALYDLFYNYFYVNMTAYGGTEGILSHIVEPVKLFLKTSIEENKFSFACIVLGYIYMFYRWVIREKKFLSYGLLCLLLFVSIIFVYWGIGWTYYYLFFMPFMVFAFVGLAQIFEKLSRNHIVFALEFVLGTILLVGVTYKVNNNAYMLSYTKDDVCYYHFSEIMNQYENPTLLVYSSIDANLFTIANILPSEKYFFTANLDKEKFSELQEEQKNYIIHKKVDFVLVKYLQTTGDFSHVPGLEENYRFVGEGYYATDGKDYQHLYLFQLKDLK